MDLGIAGRKAAVAASSAGLGLGTAKALAEAGVQVALCSRDRGRVEAAAAALPGEGHVPLVADVSDAAGGKAFVEAAVEALGEVDILICNAGGPSPGTFGTKSPDDFPSALDLNLMSTVGMCYAAAPAMRERGWGRVVAITSISVRQPISNLILSNTSRAGVTGFLKSVAIEIAGDGVTVNTIQPGIHLTDRLGQLDKGGREAMARSIPTGTLGDAEDFGRAAAFLCSTSARFITGASLNVDGGAYQALQ
ncbi:MAG: SDR family oxidoreductase [Acidimicrobiia bacterium]|nr:SDR family oxidoreductase [Acidimicrobiia bacterium]